MHILFSYLLLEEAYLCLFLLFSCYSFHLSSVHGHTPNFPVTCPKCLLFPSSVCDVSPQSPEVITSFRAPLCCITFLFSLYLPLLVPVHLSLCLPHFPLTASFSSPPLCHSLTQAPSHIESNL